MASLPFCRNRYTGATRTGRTGPWRRSSAGIPTAIPSTEVCATSTEPMSHTTRTHGCGGDKYRDVVAMFRRIATRLRSRYGPIASHISSQNSGAAMAMNTAMTPPIPPKELRFMGEADDAFLPLCDQYAGQILDFVGHADPDYRLVDVGCGYGRLAYGLVRAGFPGRYFGFDVLGPQIAWLRDNFRGM